MKNTTYQELNLNHFTLKYINWFLTSQEDQFKYIMINNVLTWRVTVNFYVLNVLENYHAIL